MSKQEFSQPLPTWSTPCLGDIAEFVMGQAPPGIDCNFDGDGAIFVKAGEFGPERPFVREWTVRPLKTALSTDVLICVVGATAGKLNLGLDCAIGRSVAAIRPDAVLLDQLFLFNFLKTKISDLRGNSTGSAQGVISKDVLACTEIPLAPLPEQRRIVAKLDALQSRTRIAREALDAVAPLLKSFRQSVLQAAVTGALTEEWRSKQRKLPDWKTVLISDAGKIQLGRQRSPKYHSGDNMRPYLRVQNVFEDRLDLSDVMTMDFPNEDFERYQLHPGDILLNEGQSPELLGRPAMYRGELEGACFTNTLIRFQANQTVLPDFALLVFRSYMHSGKFRQEGTITTNIAHLGAGRFANLDFPLPPLAEQTEIVKRVQCLFAMADAMEAELAAAQRAMDQLDQSVLATAFRGELVPQDPSDEPASVLLERIRAARAALPQSKSKRGRQAPDPSEGFLMAAEPAAPRKRGRPGKGTA